MRKFNLEIKNKTKEDTFLLELKYTPRLKKEVDFRFSNANKRLERNDIVFTDENSEVVQKKTISFPAVVANPKITRISKDEPFIYEVTGFIQEELDSVIINLGTATFELDKGKEYSLHINIPKGKSNVLTVVF